MLGPFTQCRSVQRLVLLMSTLVVMFAKIREFVVPAGTESSRCTTWLRPVPVRIVRTGDRFGRYRRTSRERSELGRVMRARPAPRLFS